MESKSWEEMEKKTIKRENILPWEVEEMNMSSK